MRPTRRVLHDPARTSARDRRWGRTGSHSPSPPATRRNPGRQPDEAIVSHLATGYDLGEVGLLIVLAVLTALSWPRRPPSRRT
jgi:hypothetical protein